MSSPLRFDNPAQALADERGSLAVSALVDDPAIHDVHHDVHVEHVLWSDLHQVQVAGWLVPRPHQAVTGWSPLRNSHSPLRPRLRHTPVPLAERR
jgi:hypothetical protein